MLTTPSILPSKSNCPLGYSTIWTRFLGSWNSWSYFLNCQNRRERENVSTLWSPVWAESGNRFKGNLQPFTFMGFDRWKPRLPKVAGLPLWRSSSKDSGFSLQVLWCLHEEDLIRIWVGKKTNTQKRTWSKLTFLYCSTLLLRNPNIVSAFIFCSSTFTYMQYYVIEEKGKMQVNSTLFYTLYICIPALFIWVLLKR